jgi:hypothetical protein
MAGKQGNLEDDKTPRAAIVFIARFLFGDA